jgi:flagellar motor protein MotB
MGSAPAFGSTIYGLSMADLVRPPAAHRIRARVAEAFETQELVMEGALCPFDKMHPSLVAAAASLLHTGGWWRLGMSRLKPRYFQAEGTIATADGQLHGRPDDPADFLCGNCWRSALSLRRTNRPYGTRRPVYLHRQRLPRLLSQRPHRSARPWSTLDLLREPRGLVISIPQAVLFGSGVDEVSPRTPPVVEDIAAVLRDIPNQISLVGHADAVPIHNRHFKSNWNLSTARSLSLLALLSRRYGIEESRLSVASYGPYRPTGSNDTPAGRALNRRVEIVILVEPARP